MTTDGLGRNELPVPFMRDAPGLADRQVDGGFDYNALPSNIACGLVERRNAIRGAITKTTEAMIAIGRDLIAAKKMLGHGRFVDWVQTECGFSIRTAHNYMAISRVSAKCAFVAHLSVSLVLRLARTRGRRELLGKISAQIGLDGRVTEEQVRGLLEKFIKLRQLRPKRETGPNRRRILKPVERPSPQYSGHTKTEYARLNAEFILKYFGPHGLLAFRTILSSGTLDETLRFVEIEILRWEIESGLREVGVSNE
jgi:hypothetical protein